MSGDDDRFDGLYLNVAQTTRGIEPLLDTVFSFLRRKTDFFAGPPGGDTADALAMVQRVAEKHATLYQQAKNPTGKTTKKAASTTSTKKKKTTKTTKKSPATDEKKEDVIEMGADGEFDASATDSMATPKPKSAEKSAAPSPKKTPETKTAAPPKSGNTATNTDDEDTDKKTPPPLGNGGATDKYAWTQTLSEITINVPVPENTRGRDLSVVMNKKHLKVALRNAPTEQPPLINAPLTKTIICDDSFWTIEDGDRLVLNLQKLNAMEWWDSVCTGDATIDVTKIQPENSSVSDLDGETRQTVEKMMYDQRQKAAGKPTSAEEEKMAMFEKFKVQHPELDFSNAKMS